MTTNVELLRALFAGWACGIVAGFASATTLVIWATRRPALAGRLGLPRLGFAATWILAANALVIGWSLVGLVLGAAYHAVGTPRFSVAVLAVLGGVAALYLFVRGRPGGLEARVLAGAVAMGVLAFAVVLPLLAG